MKHNLPTEFIEACKTFEAAYDSYMKVTDFGYQVLNNAGLDFGHVRENTIAAIERSLDVMFMLPNKFEFAEDYPTVDELTLLFTYHKVVEALLALDGTFEYMKRFKMNTMTQSSDYHNRLYTAIKYFNSKVQ